MTRIARTAPFALLALAVLFSTAGCKSNANNNQPAADTSQGPTPDSASDPANANLAPVSNTTTAQEGTPPPADNGAYSDQSSAQGPVDDSDYGETADDYATQPPPPLPDYQQPPSPGDDYLWTPGYWNYASAGYYWVPGVWVQAPYQGALWTPATGDIPTAATASSTATGARTSASTAA